MADSVAAVDVRRRAGWLPGDQDELEAWLAGHRERVEAKGDQVVPHPVIEEFQELMDRDPVVRMYLNQMIAQVPQGKPYRKRHLEGVPQMLRLINEVLTMAPEFGEDALVMTPLGAILDWAMGTPAGFAAFRDRRINAMFGKILTEDVPAFVELESGGPPPVACRVVGVGQSPNHPTKEGDRREQHLSEGPPLCPA